DPHYYSRYIRFMGIATNEGTQCSTLGYPLELNALNDLGNSNKETAVFSLAATPDIAGTESELMIQFSQKGNTAIWVLDSS
ncbi:hypothetical protein P8631_21990, partial [Guyparkeria sp. 1SP6A2]|nr:hypothetical protein [Guyparkeria sp. 1SP6A2]